MGRSTTVHKGTAISLVLLLLFQYAPVEPFSLTKLSQRPCPHCARGWCPLGKKCDCPHHSSGPRQRAQSAPRAPSPLQSDTGVSGRDVTVPGHPAIRSCDGARKADGLSVLTLDHFVTGARIRTTLFISGDFLSVLRPSVLSSRVANDIVYPPWRVS